MSGESQGIIKYSLRNILKRKKRIISKELWEHRKADSTLVCGADGQRIWPKEVVLRSDGWWSPVSKLRERERIQGGIPDQCQSREHPQGACDHQAPKVGKVDPGGHETGAKCPYLILQAMGSYCGVSIWGWQEQVWVLCAHSGCCIGNGSQPVWDYK